MEWLGNPDPSINIDEAMKELGNLKDIIDGGDDLPNEFQIDNLRTVPIFGHVLWFEIIPESIRCINSSIPLQKTYANLAFSHIQLQNLTMKLKEAGNELQTKITTSRTRDSRIKS